MSMSVPGNSCRPPCLSSTTTTGCPIRVSGKCVYYAGSALSNPSINTGEDYDSILAKLVAAIGGSGSGSVTSVGLTMPAAFFVAGTPITTSGTFAVTATGTTSEYIRGDGTLATFPAIPVLGANNGVNLDGTNIQLGGTLLENTLIDTTSAFSLTIAGSDGAIPLIVNSANNISGQFNSQTSIGIQATGGDSFPSGHFTNSTPYTNSIIDAIHLQHQANGSPASLGIGVGVSMNVSNSVGLFQATRLISKWTDITHATRTSEFSITGVSNGVTSTLFTVSGNGAIRFNNYSTGAFAGTPTRLLGTDASGNVLQTAVPATLAFNNGLTNNAGTVQLGGFLVQDTNINTGSNYLGIIGNSGDTSIQFASGLELRIGMHIQDQNEIGDLTGISIDVPYPNSVGIRVNATGGTFGASAPIGVSILSDGGMALAASGRDTYTTSFFSSNTSSTIHGVLTVNRQNPVTGQGMSIDFDGNSLLTTASASRIASVYTIWGGGGGILQSRTELQFHTKNVGDSGTSSKMVIDGFGNLGVGVAVPLGAIHLKGGTTTVPPILISSGVLTSALVDGSLEYDGSFMYFTAGGVRNPLSTAGTSFYTADGTITSARTIDADAFPIIFSDVGLFRITEGTITVGGTYDFNNGVDFLVYDAANSSNLVMNSVTGLTFEYTDLSGPTVLSSLTVNGSGTTFTGSVSLPAFTSGSVLFTGSAGIISQDNANLFWDNTNNRLGIGTSSPAANLHISGGTVSFTGGGAGSGQAVIITPDIGASAVLNVTNSAASVNWLTVNGSGEVIMNGGSVIIGGTGPHASSKFQVDSTTQGFLPPRMTTTQRDAISSPAAGLMIYNNTTNKLNFYNGTAWEAVTSS